jgi:hypothetical protein
MGKSLQALKKAKKKPKVLRPDRPSDDFVSIARRLECEEDKGRFEAKLKKIAKAQPKTHKT